MTQTHKLSHGALATATHRSASTLPKSSTKADEYKTNPSGIVVGLTVTMGWQLAVVVLLPLFGGHVLDDHLNSSPLWTLIGLVIAMVAMVLVVRQTLSQLNEYTTAPTDTDKTVKKGKA